MFTLRFKVNPDDFIAKDDEISTTYVSGNGIVTKVFKKTGNFHIDLSNIKKTNNGNNNNNRVKE